MIDRAVPRGTAQGRLAVMRLLCLLLVAACTATPDAAGTPSPAELTVMSFNIRYGTAADGENHWRHRRELCAARIRHFAPDVLGLQEALAFQNEFLLAACPGYTAIGVGRDDGGTAGEFSTLFVRTARFTVLASGTFWLSETPATPGSRSWDSALPRIATWARVVDRLAGDRPLLLVNTHFDHRGEQARAASARLLRRFVAEHAEGAAVVVTGDFNTAPGSAPWRTLTDATDPAGRLHDAWATLHPDAPAGTAGTFHAFKAEPGVARIDWILHSSGLTARTAHIDRHHEGALFPSDHCAVVATFTLR